MTTKVKIGEREVIVQDREVGAYDVGGRGMVVIHDSPYNPRAGRGDFENGGAEVVSKGLGIDEFVMGNETWPDLQLEVNYTGS